VTLKVADETAIIDRDQRRKASVEEEALVGEMYLAGVSVRRMTSPRPCGGRA